jgi:hypothetical protein
LVILDAPPKSSGFDKPKEWVESRGRRGRAKTMGPLRNRQKLNQQFAAAMVETATPEYVRWISATSNHTPDEIAALTNEAAAYMDFEADLRALKGKMPLLYVVREDWQGLAKAWIAENTPDSTIEALGRHLMFWEHADRFNQVQDEFLTQVRR